MQIRNTFDKLVEIGSDLNKAPNFVLFLSVGCVLNHMIKFRQV